MKRVSCCCGPIGTADKVAAAGASMYMEECWAVGLDSQRKVCDGIGILGGEVIVTRE